VENFHKKPGSPGDILDHSGVKGMKWGVRKERAKNLKGALADKGTITRTTKNGDTFTLSTKPPKTLAKSLAFASKRYSDLYSRSAYLEIKNKHASRIGEASFSFDKKDPTVVHLSWVTVDKSVRGQGYASEILRSAEVHLKSQGVKTMTLDVPPIAKDAQHIYTKMGFKADPKETRDSEDFIRMVRQID
jgi:ribosomal protein S18 acetylase RimI-like enzyme